MDATIEKNGITYTLDGIEKDSWIELFNGSLQTKNAFHQPVFGTISQGLPALRTVVLRKVLAEEKKLFLHTDMRSRKIEEIKSNPNVSWLFYNFDKKLQIRINGFATIHSNDALAAEAWDRTGMNSRKTYMITASPSTTTPIPDNGLPETFAQRDPTPDESNSGRANFCVIVTEALQLDWLWLNSKGHRRALFTYENGKAIKGEWIVP